MQHLLSAVAFLHENWILHRDIKSSNLLLTNQGVLKVAYPTLLLPLLIAFGRHFVIGSIELSRVRVGL